MQKINVKDTVFVNPRSVFGNFKHCLVLDKLKGLDLGLFIILVFNFLVVKTVKKQTTGFVECVQVICQTG